MRFRWIAFAVLALAATQLLAATEIAPGTFLIRGGFKPGSQPDGNSIILDAPDGLIVIDTGRHVEHTQSILDFARDANKPVKAILNSHWHLDHIGGNAMLRRAFPDVQIYATGALANARRGFLANYRGQLEQMIRATANDPKAQESFRTEIALIDAGDALAPTVVVGKSGMRTIAGRELHLGLEQNAVTEGDLWFRDPSTRIVFAGDLVTLPAPFLDTACPARWKASLTRLGKVDFDLLVPGHGQPLTKEQFATYRRAFDRLLSCAASDALETICIDQWIAGTGSLAREDDPKFVRMLMDYYVDVLRRDPKDVAPLCGS